MDNKIKLDYLKLLSPGISKALITNASCHRKSGQVLFCFTITRTQLEYRSRHNGQLIHLKCPLESTLSHSNEFTEILLSVKHSLETNQAHIILEQAPQSW